MISESEQINQKLNEILSPEAGYFGRVYTWGQEQEKYVYIGYELSKEFLPVLEKLTNDQKKSLVNAMNYFEIHALPLKTLLTTQSENALYEFYSKITWSQFMIVVMFGMLEITAKEKTRFWNKKQQKITKFLEENLSASVKDSITKRYKVEELFRYHKTISTFADVIDHLWNRVRSGFIHDAGIETTAMEWNSLEGLGTKEEPLHIKSNVPVQEFLQIAWQAILHFYGYEGELVVPSIKHEHSKQKS